MIQVVLVVLIVVVFVVLIVVVFVVLIVIVFVAFLSIIRICVWYDRIKSLIQQTLQQDSSSNYIYSMLQKIFQAIMRRYFGQFLTGIENVQLAFWTGKINLHNIALKHEKINQLLRSKNIPFTIKYSHIGSLSIDIPWKSLSSTPVQIKISDVYIVMKMEKYTSVTRKIEEEKLSLIKNYIQYLIKKSMENESRVGDQEEGYFKKMLVKIAHNLNAEVKNISIRIVSENQLAGAKTNGDNQRMSSQSFMSLKSGADIISATDRRPSETNSQYMRRSQKYFAFGFCIQQFSLSTVDQNFNKTFYNLDNKKSPVRKIMTMKQISLYMEQQSKFNIFKVSQQKKNQFMRDIIPREKHRLLSVDGRIMMNRNVEKEQFYDYLFTMQLEMLEIGCTYAQLREIIKIIANFSAASQTKQIKKLSQLDQRQQQMMKEQFIALFPKIHDKNYEISTNDPDFGKILLSVSKKNILMWTKECAIGIIKETRLQMLKKQKNKKGWLSYIISQSEVDLTDKQVTQIYQEVEELIKTIQNEKKLAIKAELVFSKIVLLLSHEQFQERISLELQNTKLHYKTCETLQLQTSLCIQNISLNYYNWKQAQKLNVALLTRGVSEFYKDIVLFQFRKHGHRRKIVAEVSEININHQNHVLLLVNELIKLKAKEQMKSDIKLAKAEMAQAKDIGAELGKVYVVDIKVHKIILKIEVNDNSYILVSLDSVSIQTQEKNNQHAGSLKNLNISFVSTSHKKAIQKEHINSILKDFSVLFTISNYFNKIHSKMESLELNVCEADLHSIYRGLSKQALIFKAQKVQQKNKQIHQYSYLKGHLKLLTTMKNWKQYQGVLTDEALYFFQEQIYDQEEKRSENNQKYSHVIPLNNCFVTIVNQEQFKLQSDAVNQLIECSPQQLQKWVELIEKLVFENSSKFKMYKLLENEEGNQSKNSVAKYETEVVFELDRIQALVCENRSKNLLRLTCGQFLVVLKQNQLQYERTISISQVLVKKLDNTAQTQMNFLINISKDSKILPITIELKGKKKLHPQYRGQIQISVSVPHIKVNYDPQFIYRMIKKIAWGYEVPSYTNEMRNTKVLQHVKQFLHSSTYEKREQQLKAQNCKVLQDYRKYSEINTYRAQGNKCLVLLAFELNIDSAQINMINGLNNVCIFNAKASEMKICLDKGSQFMFFKLTIRDVTLNDCTGYPNTNIKPFKIAQLYPLIHRKENPINKDAVQCYFSKFDLDRFMNKSRIKGLFYLELFDVQVNFQNQLINRFSDYLLNQIIGFILAPNSLHKYDGPRRGPYLYQYGQSMTQRQVREVIKDALQPFFNKIFINADNLTAKFNSFPQLQGFNLEIQTLRIQTHNFEKNQKIRFNTNELNKYEKHPVYKELLKIPAFQEKLLKNQWVSRMDIIAEGIKSIIFASEVPKLETYVERTLNSQKQMLFPFVALDTSLLCQSFVKNLSIKAPKSIYNLINKCIMHNVSYDDGQDAHFAHNFQFRNFMKMSQIFYRLKADSLQIIVPQIKTVVALPDFEYKFIRYPSMIKEMAVQSRTMNIFKGSEVIMMTSEYKDKNNRDINGLTYKIEMKLNGQKPMEVKLCYIDIQYNLPFFLQFAQYTILDQSCYPPLPPGTIVNQLPDLPVIACKVHMENSRIKLIVPDSENDDEFICSGNISLLWVRNSLPHPDKYANNPEHFPNGKEWCSYRIQLKGVQIRKHYQMKMQTNSNSQSQETRVSYNQSQLVGKSRYRSISNKISLVFKISQLMKLAQNNRDRYNDNIFDVKITQLGLKLSFVDIQHLKSVFVKKEEPKVSQKDKDKFMMQQSESEMPQLIKKAEEQIKPAPPQTPLTYTPYTKYSLEINLIQVQLGLSELPVPLLDFMIKNAVSSLQILGSNINGELKATVVANCWNMLIGRWQPIIEELSPVLSFRLGRDKYLLFDCKKMVLFNVSLQTLKILKLLSSDFAQKGKFSISQIWTGSETSSDNKVKGMNVSPYVLTNRTGISFQVSSLISDTKTKLKPEQKTYVDLKNYQMDFSEKLKVDVEFEGGASKFQVNMDLATCKKITFEYKQRNHELLLRPISNSIMKEIIVSSLFVIENKTSFAMSFYYNCGLDESEKDTYEGRIKVLPKEKTALKFTANIKNLNTKGPQKHLKLDFPQLQKYEIENNFEFPYQAILNDYEHRIDLGRNKSFNCVVGIRQQMETTIVVEPSFYVKNLLPVDIRIQFVVQKTDKDKGQICPFELKVNEEKDVYDFNSKQKIQVRLKIKGFNISSFQSISTTAANNHEVYKQHLQLIDYRGHPGKIAIKIARHNKVRKMYIFSEAVLINETKYDWFVFHSSTLIPGQKLKQVQEEGVHTFLSASEYQTLNFGFSDDTPFISNEIKIGQLGIHNVSMYKNEQLYEFTIKSTFHCLENDALIYSYVLKAEPKYVLVNETNCVLQIAQEDTENKSIYVQVGQRLNWVWPVRSEIKQVKIRTIQNEVQVEGSEWLFSSPLNITSQQIEQSVIVLRPKDNKVTKKLIKITPIKQNQSTFFVIEDVKKPEDYLITINNELQHCKLRAYQQCINDKDVSWSENKYFDINPKNSSPIGWDFPNQQQNLRVEISFVGYLRTKFDPHSLTLSLDKQKVQQVTITNEDEETQAITIKIEIIGLRKKITFLQQQGQQQEDTELQMMHTGNRFAFSLTEIGLSVISSVRKRSELIFLNLKKVEIIMMEKKSSRSLQVKIKYINIDNNYNHNTIYPILLTPLKHEKTLKKSRPFFVLLLEQTLQSKDIIQIKELRICNQPLSIKIHDEVLTAVLQMVQEMNKETDKSQGKIDLLSIFRSYFEKMEWQESRLIKPQRDIFFREFQIAKLQLQLTFSIRPKLNANNFIIMTILSSFGAAISNVSEAQLTLSRFLKKDKGLSELKTELSDFYLMQFMKGIYKVLGSINLFGNPYVFIRMIAEGAWEIVNQPTEGFIKGPVEGAFGIVKGGVCFTRNVVAGTCNSFEAISQSISRGVSYMTMDEKFIERREKIKIQKSNHFFKGLQYGGFAFYTGIQVAITGLVRHPVEGYSKNGFLGGVTGALKGFAGLVTKPISGTFEGISKISQGIKNTALMFQDGPNSKRIRPPRIFYSELAYYKNYNIFQSTAISILEFCSTKYLNEQINYISLLHNEEKQQVHAYVMSEKYLSHLDILSKKLIQQVEISSIKQIKIQQNRLHIVTNRTEIVMDGQNYQQLFEALHKYYFYNL